MEEAGSSDRDFWGHRSGRAVGDEMTLMVTIKLGGCLDPLTKARLRSCLDTLNFKY
jgi:hypothetical protein